jgi:hypothetical protein
MLWAKCWCVEIVDIVILNLHEKIVYYIKYIKQLHVVLTKRSVRRANKHCPWANASFGIVDE